GVTGTGFIALMQGSEAPPCQMNKENYMPDSKNLSTLSGPVRITVPASVAFNLEKMQTVFRNIGENIGCGTCYSGADCILQFERDWVVDPATLRLNGVTPVVAIGQVER
ncbi:MAG: hypothetical protein ACRD5L_02510, partial [Bryobacteraceae bacterium]